MLRTSLENNAGMLFFDCRRGDELVCTRWHVTCNHLGRSVVVDVHKLEPLADAAQVEVNRLLGVPNSCPDQGLVVRLLGAAPVNFCGPNATLPYIVAVIFSYWMGNIQTGFRLDLLSRFLLYKPSRGKSCSVNIDGARSNLSAQVGQDAANSPVPKCRSFETLLRGT